MYKLNQSGVTRLADGAHIPFADGNRDYADYQAWLAAGNQPLPIDVTPFADLARAYLDEVRETRERVLNRLAGIATAAIAADDAVTTAAFVVCRQQLLDLTKAPAILAASNMDQLKAAVLATYRSIVGAAPANIRSAFNNVDA